MSQTLPRKQLIPALLGFILIFAIGALSISSFVDRARQRDLRAWESMLGVLADSRQQDVERWLEVQAAVMQELADNASLRFYVSQLDAAQAAGAGDGEGNAAQAAYLRNLVEATAERALFSGGTQGKVQANIDRALDSGIVVVDSAGRPLVETSGFRLDDTLRTSMLAAIKDGKPQLRDVYENGRGELVIGFVAPVFPVQMTGGARPLGAVAGVKRVRDELFPLLKRRGGLAAHEETVLLRKDGAELVFVSPTADGAQPLRRRLPATAGGLVESAAVEAVGGFFSGSDHAGREVLAVSRALRAAPWVLLSAVDAGEALRESQDHRRFLLTAFSLASLLLGCALVAAWWHGSSVRARASAAALEAKTRQLSHQSALMQSVIDGSPDLIFTLDDGRLGFSNQAFALAVGGHAETLAGKTLSSIIGPAAATSLAALLADSAASGQPVSRMLEIELQGVARTMYCTVLPIVGATASASVLCIVRDMTEAQREQSRRQRLMQQLVAALTSIVDRHDPYCAEHSMRTALVATAVGRELELPAAALERLDMAARLANLGKIFLPRELLTKAETLSADEQKQVQSHVQLTLDVLSDIDFDGPVLDIVAQKNEYLDGSGYPAGLAGDALCLEGRILAVANAFVAMVSARSYRAGVSLEETLGLLLRDAGVRYDRHVVAALFHVAENRPEWIDWSAPAPRDPA
jgi:PAS domain-containing protein